MINIDTIRKWWEVFVEDSDYFAFTEVRILGKFQYSGYFNTVDALIQAIEPYADMDEEQVYFVLNRIDIACYGRQQSGKILKSPKITTNDNDIVRRKWVLCDFDPLRKSGTNASDEEFELAHKKAQDVFKFLRDRGFADPVICKSGNGWHLLYKIDEEANDENTEIIKGFFKYMGQEFSDDRVEFDEKNFNAARLCKLYGTMAKKGANLVDRPWRMSEIVYVPNDIQTTPLEKFNELADLLPKEEPKAVPNRRQYQGINAPFDLKTWLDQHGIIYREQTQGTSVKYVLQHCPWEDTHSSIKEWESSLFVDVNGKICFNCFHSHCKDKTWQDFRLFYEPNAYDRPTYQPQQVVYVQQPFVQQPKKRYEIKDEIPELGEKWLSLSSIKKIDITKLEKVKTGFGELDGRIGGLYMSEVTILSGSNASGKSSWLNSVLLNIINQGYKVALWSGELRGDILKSWIQMVAAGRRNVMQSQYDEGRYYVPDHIAEKIDQWLDGRFFLYNNEYGNVASQMLNDIKILANAGVKVFALDNMMSMNIDVFDGDKNDRQKALILALKDFAMREQVHIILVAHPRKSVAFLRKTDISGTGDIINAVDNCFIYHRCNEDFIHAITDFYNQAKANQLGRFGNVLSIEKNRLYGIVDVFVGLYYEPESRRFKNAMEEDIHYKWEEIPTQAQMSFQEPQVNVNYQHEPKERELTDEDIIGEPLKETPF